MGGWLTKYTCNWEGGAEQSHEKVVDKEVFFRHANLAKEGYMILYALNSIVIQNFRFQSGHQK